MYLFAPQNEQKKIYRETCGSMYENLEGSNSKTILRVIWKQQWIQCFATNLQKFCNIYETFLQIVCVF